jgi:ABC-type sugar transport system ATPase subunit
VAAVSEQPLLECAGVTVDFDGTRALDAVTLSFRPGEIVGVVGPNGAGKSTLGRVIVGELPAGTFEGELRLEGESVQFKSSRDAHAAGIVLIHQERSAVPDLSIGENVMLTIEPRKRLRIDWPELHRRAAQHLRMVGVEADTHARLADAGVAVQHLVEVARALATGSRLFVFDESTAALGAEEVGILFRRMRELRDSDAAVLFVSHRLQEILEVSDRVVVMRDGRVALDAPRAAVDHESLVRAMLGAEYREFEAVDTGAPPAEEILLELRGWTVPATPTRKVGVGPVDIGLRRGEVLGVFGPLGAGKSELLASLFGLYGSEPQGELALDGRPVRFASPREALEHGVALIPSDRRNEGIAPGQSVRDNIIVSTPQGVARFGILRHREIDRLCRQYIDLLGIRVASVDEEIDHLSGGNQQKVLLARAIAVARRVMLLDEPTRGIDVGAKVDVYGLVRDLADRGTTCVFSSMEADEVLRICDRILVLRDGRAVATLDAAATSERELLQLSTGGGPA